LNRIIAQGMLNDDGNPSFMLTFASCLFHHCLPPFRWFPQR
jgi:hypothetical protein